MDVALENDQGVAGRGARSEEEEQLSRCGHDRNEESELNGGG